MDNVIDVCKSVLHCVYEEVSPDAVNINHEPIFSEGSKIRGFFVTGTLHH
jgi:hypothetical protein